MRPVRAETSHPGGPARRPRSGSPVLAAGLLLLGWPVAGAAAQDLDTAQRSAFEQSFVLRSDRARQDGAEARLRGTYDAFMPSVAFLASEPLDSRIKYNPDLPRPTLLDPSFGPDTVRRRDVPQYGIQVSLPLFDGFGRWNNMLSARSLADAGRNLTLDARQQVLLGTASAYLAVVRDRRILDLRTRQLAGTVTIRDGVAAKFAVNDATRTDVALADSRIAEAHAGLDQAAAELKASELEFVRLTGRPPGRLAPLVLPHLPMSEEQFAERVRGGNPRLAANRLDAQAAGYLAQAAKASLLPQVALEFTHGKQSDITGTLKSVTETTTRVVARVPIYEPGAIPKISEASAFARQKSFDTEEAVRQTETAARAGFQRRLGMQLAVSSLSQRVAALRAAVRGYEIERGAGFRTVIDELNARSELAQAEILLATGEAERDRLAFVLAALAGALGEGRAGPPGLATGGPVGRPVSPGFVPALAEASKASPAQSRPLPAPGLATGQPLRIPPALAALQSPPAAADPKPAGRRVASARPAKPEPRQQAANAAPIRLGSALGLRP